MEELEDIIKDIEKKFDNVVYPKKFKDGKVITFESLLIGGIKKDGLAKGFKVGINKYIKNRNSLLIWRDLPHFAERMDQGGKKIYYIRARLYVE